MVSYLLQIVTFCLGKYSYSSHKSNLPSMYLYIHVFFHQWLKFTVKREITLLTLDCSISVLVFSPSLETTLHPSMYSFIREPIRSMYHPPVNLSNYKSITHQRFRAFVPSCIFMSIQSSTDPRSTLHVSRKTSKKMKAIITLLSFEPVTSRCIFLYVLCCLI